MRTLTVPLSILVLLAAGCATTSATHVAVAVTPASAPHELLASLERTACYGRCPAYVVSVYADGVVEFDGRQFTATQGLAKATLTADELAAVRRALDASGFASFKAAYADTRTSDLPWATVQVGRKSVRHYTGDESAPPALTELERALDVLLGTSRWLAGPEQ
jgi:hypothetical protein